MTGEQSSTSVRKPGITRRRVLLLLVSAGAAAAAYVGGWWSARARPRDVTYLVKAILRDRLSYLQLDEEGLDAFAKDFQARIPDDARHTLSWMGILKPVPFAWNVARSSRWSYMIRKLETGLELRYLISTDFFQHDAREDRIIKYMGFYDPYERPCSNPFARYE